MQRLVIVFVSLVLIGTVKCNWQLVWSDEFNGNHLDENNWKYHTGVHKRNHELEFYTSHRHENVRVENGHLVIEARPEEYQGSNFTSGRLDGKKAWTYGKFEARAKLPSGHNLWPAIWMMPRDSKYGIWAASGEIDIMELRGDKPHEIMGTIHYGGSWPNNIYHGSGERYYQQDFSQDYHTFALEWEQKEIRWYVDGKHYHAENIDRNMWSKRGKNPYNKNGEPFDQPFYLTLNVAVGGTFFGPGPYVTPEEAKHWKKPTMEVDYVRVYQWK